MKKLLITLIFTLTPVMAWAKGELVMEREIMYWTAGVSDTACTPPIKIEVGRDVPDLRDEKCGSESGKFSLTLSGPPGTTVTLFGSYNFKKYNGFLIIKKKDDQLLWVKDLVDLPAGQFSSEANEDSGAFETFFKSSPMFEESVSSVKWGDHHP